MNPFDTNTPIPEDGISNFQREAAYLLVTGKGLKNPLLNRIQRAKRCIEIQIAEFDLIIEVIESGIESANGCLQCGDFPYQCALDVKSKLEELMFEVELLEIHTNRISGSEVNRVDEFLSRLTLAGQYTRAMKTLTGEDKERYTHVFNSLINGDFCMEKICKDTMCVPGDALCSEFNTQSGIGGLAIRLKANPAACNCAINRLIPGLIECVSGLIADDELNYCEALRVVRKYSGGTQLTTEALNDPLVSQLIDNLFATNALKGPLKKLRDGNLNAEEIEEEAKKYYAEFVDPGGTLECGLEGITVVAGATGPPGPQGAPGCAGPPGEPGQNCNCPGDDPTGACCVGEYCTQVTAQQCAFFGGDYYGDGSECYDASTGLGVRCFPDGGCGIDEDCPPGQICCNGQCVEPCPPFPDGTGGGGCPPCAPCPPDSTECPPGSGNCCPTVNGLFACCNGQCVQPCPYAGGCPECGDGTCCDAPGDICCGGNCCDVARCCGNGYCCADGEVCCGGGGPCCPAGDCCGGSCIDRSFQQCCNDVPKPIDDLCCEEFEGECRECSQVRGGIIGGCEEDYFGVGVADRCCRNECCPNNDPQSENDCCTDDQNCCPGIGCCNGECCNAFDRCCGEDEKCCGEFDCCTDDEQCCGSGPNDPDSFCCPDEDDCCPCENGTYACLNDDSIGSPTPCFTCLDYDYNNYPDYVYEGNCECGCPPGTKEVCGVDQGGMEVCICCDTDLEPCDTGGYPTCCDNSINEYCCDPIPGIWEGGCKDVGDCGDCKQEQCDDGVTCCELYVEIGYYERQCAGGQTCLGYEVPITDDNGNVTYKCYADEFCCGGQCKLITDCRKYLEDYINHGDSHPNWMNFCCCQYGQDVKWCDNGCCCQDCSEGTAYSYNGCAKECDQGATYNMSGGSPGCKCPCGSQTGSSTFPDSCEKVCEVTGESYNPAECGAPTYSCPSLSCPQGQTEALACDGKRKCFDPTDTSQCGQSFCLYPCAGDYDNPICDNKDCMVYCKNEDMDPCQGFRCYCIDDLEGEDEDCEPSLMHIDSVQCMQEYQYTEACAATCQTYGPAGRPDGPGFDPAPEGPPSPFDLTPTETRPKPRFDQDRYNCGRVCPSGSIGNCGFNDCGDDCTPDDCCGMCTPGDQP